MKTRLQWLDLAVSTVWIICLLCVRGGWNEIGILFAASAALLRVVLSFSLFMNEKRSWLPLLLYAGCWVVLYNPFTNDGITCIAPYAFTIFGIEQNLYVNMAIRGCLYLWIVFAPFICYLVLLCRRRLVRTEMTYKDMCGALMWNDRRAKYYSAFLAIVIISVFTGKAMFSSLCEIMCLTLTPLCYWIICRYYGLKARKLWVMFIALFIFWHGQRLGGVFRVAALLTSFCMIAYVCYDLFRQTRKLLLTGISILYLAVVLPSFSIGYNQYACINYPRSGFYYLAPYRGILYIHDKTAGELYGLRDRFGLLVKPEYERIEMGDERGFDRFCRLEKNGYTQLYYILDNEIITSERDEQLQSELCGVLENYYFNVDAAFADRGEIKVTDLVTGKVTGDARIVMYGNSSRCYEDEYFLPDDTMSISSGEYVFSDSVRISKSAYSDTKKVLSYSENLPDSIYSRYNVYIRLGGDNRPSVKDIQYIMAKVKKLKCFSENVAK